MTHADALQLAKLLIDLRDGVWWIIFLLIVRIIFK